MNDPRKIIGGVWPMGVAIGQSWFELGALAWLCGRYEIESFVEIGMLQGGLSSVLFGRTLFNKDFRYLGIEYDPRFLPMQIQAAAEWFDRFEIMEADVFEIETIKATQNWIKKNNGPAIVYCDNGDKPKELEIYSRAIRFGDLIAAHDFGNEYHERDLPEDDSLKRIKSDWLTDTHIVAFEKTA